MKRKKKQPRHVISFNSSRSALVNSPMFLSSNWLHLTLVLRHPPPPPSPHTQSHFWHIYHISMSLCLCHSADHVRFPGPHRTPRGRSDLAHFPLQWQFSSSTPLLCKKKKKKNILETRVPRNSQKKKRKEEKKQGGFPLRDIDCQCQFQYDECQRYEDRHDPKWAGWPFPNVTCHRSFMSPSKQYVKSIKNHYAQELCYTGQKIIIKIILFKAKLRFGEIYDGPEHKG